MKYSIVELAPIAPSGTNTEALRLALRAAHDAEEAGYHRIWYAEHHHARSYASADPVPLIALAAHETSTIRVGSGAILLNHHSAFAVAERFMMLQALAPGRIDLGLGRSSAGPVVDRALRQDPAATSSPGFGARVSEIVGYFRRHLDPAHPSASIDLTVGVAGVPQLWLMGSSGSSAGLAGDLGIGYTFGAHINPALAPVALDEYRSHFAAADTSGTAPRTMLALNIVAADDDATAHRLTWPARALRHVGRDRPIPTLAEAEAELSRELKGHTSTVEDGVIPDQISGTPQSLREQLAPIVRQTGVTEIIVQDMLTDVEVRRRSRFLIAQALASIDAGVATVT